MEDHAQSVSGRHPCCQNLHGAPSSWGPKQPNEASTLQQAMHQLGGRYQRPAGPSAAMGGLWTTPTSQISRNSDFPPLPSRETAQLQLQSDQLTSISKPRASQSDALRLRTTMVNW